MTAEHYYTNLKQPTRIFSVDGSFINNSKEKSLTLTAEQIVKNNLLKRNKIKTVRELHEYIKITIIVYITSFISIIIIFLFKGYRANEDTYLNGAKLVSLKLLNKIIKQYNRKNKKLFKEKHENLRKTEQLANYKFKRYNYTIANALYPIGTETKHTIITGASGSGKTVLISDLIKQIRRNGDRAIIYDRMGTFVGRFYNGDEMDNYINKTIEDNKLKVKRKKELLEYFNLKRDIILNPLDKRSPYWSIFNEARDDLDFDSIASALIPQSVNNNDPFWNMASRTLFSSVANKLKENNQTTNKDLINKLLNINLDEAAKLVKGTPAQSIIDEQNPKTALSVMSVISTNLKSLTHLRERRIEIDESGKAKEERPFSIREWIQNDDYENFLFISSRADRHETLKPLISTWLDIAINSLLSLKKSNNRKIWIIIDELPSLYELPSLQTGLAESRQFGGCFVLAMQSIAQLQSIYGDKKAKATSGLCRNRITLNTPDEETAIWCSNNLGKTEIEEVKENISFGANDLRDGVSLNKQKNKKNIITETEIMQLPDLNAYIKFAGDFPVARSEFKYVNYPMVAESYLEEDNKNNHQTIEKEIKNEYNKEVEIEQKEIEKIEETKQIEEITKEIIKEEKDKQMNSQNKNDDNDGDEELFN